MPAETLLVADKISLAFGGITALRAVSCDIRRGEIRAFIGPNGAGKTSLLNVINGFYRPQRGAIWFQGERRGALKPFQIARQGVARTFQNIALFKTMSALDNIMTGRGLHMRANIFAQMVWVGAARNEEFRHRERAEQMLDFLEISHIRDTPVEQLPYGLQKRVELGRALAAAPKLLLLDEPMAGMNLAEKEDMCRFILAAQAEFNIAIALIEHDMGVVMDLADRVLVLDYGRAIADGPPHEIKNNPRVIDAYLGAAHDAN